MIEIIKIIKKENLDFAWIYDGEYIKRVPILCTCSQAHIEDITKELSNTKQ